MNQLKQYQFNFVELQSENDQLLSEIEELKQKIKDSKFSETSIYDEIKKKKRRISWKIVRRRTTKHKTLNKAILKQLFGKQKAETSSNKSK